MPAITNMCVCQCSQFSGKILAQNISVFSAVAAAVSTFKHSLQHQFVFCVEPVFISFSVLKNCTKTVVSQHFCHKHTGSSKYKLHMTERL